MSYISHISARIVDIPTVRPHKFSFGTINQLSCVIVRLETSDGAVGWGEATTIGGASWNEESPESIFHAIHHYLIPALLDRCVHSIEAALTLMDQRCKGNYFAKSAIEQAMIDASARLRNMPAHQLLGGAVRSTLPVAWTLASGNVLRDVEEAQQALAAKLHRTFKLKIGARAPGADVDHVRAISKALNGQANLIVDINQAWDTNTALRFIPDLIAAGVTLIEQPVERWNTHGLQQASRLAGRAMVMADESVCTPHDAFALATQQACQVYSLKIAKHGGLLRTKQVASIARAAGIAWYGGTMLETSLGSAASLSVFNTIPGEHHGCELFGPRLLVDDIVNVPLKYENFEVALPTDAMNVLGFGVEVNEKQIERFDRARTGLRPVSVDMGARAA
jgi:muconate cycloisomerase